jgi:type II secretion system protein H
MMTSRTGPRTNGERPGAVGFTLVELILVMALLVVVISLIAPSLSNFFRGRNLDSEARRFLALTRYARSRAVSEGVPMLLWVDPEQRAYGLTEEYSFSSRDERAVTYHLEPDVELQLDSRGGGSAPRPPTLPGTLTLGANAITIRFEPDGFVSEASPQSLWFREQDRDGVVRPESERNVVWVTQSQNRVSYELQTNNAALVRR